MLAEGSAIQAIGLSGAAGRAAYLATFHAAQALIAPRLGKAVKIHKEVQYEFYHLIANDQGFPDELRPLLSRTYDYKSVADYGTSPDLDISPEQVAAAIALTIRFVDRIGQMLTAPP